MRDISTDRRRVIGGIASTILGMLSTSRLEAVDGSEQEIIQSQTGTRRLPPHDHSGADTGGKVIAPSQAFFESPAIAPKGVSGAEQQVHQSRMSTENKTRILTPEDTVWSSHDIFWPSVISTEHIFEDPLGKFYMYYSEDHGEPGAIGLAYSDSPLGPFTDYSGNPIISGDNERETPSAVWNRAEKELYLYYHSDAWGTAASTGLATSEDGINFSEYGTVIDVPPNTPGRGHTGYARVHRLGNDWIAYHLMGGGGDGRMGVSYSTDGKDWTVDPRPLTISADITLDNDQRVNWHHTNIVVWNGRPWWFGSIGPFVSGSDRANPRVCAAPLINERQITRDPQVLIESTERWEGDDTKIPNVLIHDSQVYIYYSTGGKIGAVELSGGTI